MKKLSIGSWAFLLNQEPPAIDFHALVHKLGHLGYQGIELFAVAPHPNPDSHDTKEKRQNLRKMVVDHRLEFSGVAPILWTEKGWAFEDQKPFQALFEKHLAFAEDLGIKTIRVDTVESSSYVRDAAMDPRLLFDRCVKAFDWCSKRAADRGVNIAWEFEPCFAFNKPSEIIALTDAVRSLDNPNFGVLYNPCHAHLCAAVGANQIGDKETLVGGAFELLQNLKGKITHLHLSDSDGTLNHHRTSTRVAFGTGVLNFDQLIPELLTCGVPNDWWCVDLCYCPDVWTVTADSKRFLDKLRHKYAA